MYTHPFWTAASAIPMHLLSERIKFTHQRHTRYSDILTPWWEGLGCLWALTFLFYSTSPSLLPLSSLAYPQVICVALRILCPAKSWQRKVLKSNNVRHVLVKQAIKGCQDWLNREAKQQPLISHECCLSRWYCHRETDPSDFLLHSLSSVLGIDLADPELWPPTLGRVSDS